MKKNNILKYKKKEDLQKDIDCYFESCFSYKRDKNGKIITDENENKCFEQKKPFTISGLAYALGINRNQLLSYGKDEKFYEIIQRAKGKCECFAEEKLFDKDTFNAAKFVLSENFSGWAVKEGKNTSAESVLKIDLTDE